MKAIVYRKFGPPEVFELAEVEKPSPKENEVLIKIHATTVVKEDPDMRAKPGFNGFGKPRNPIMGQEFAGEIEAVGESVTRFQLGDQVYGVEFFGAYAQFKCAAEDGALAVMPSNMSFEEAVTVPNGALTALHFLRDKGEVQAGQSIVIYGASGSVGSAAVQLAKHYGAEVTAVCSTANQEWVQALGADEMVDYKVEDFTQNGKTYDLIFDTVGKLAYSKSKASLTDNGTYLTTVPTPGVMFQEYLLPKKGRKNARFGAAGLQPAEKKAVDLAVLTELIEAGEYNAVIDRTYPLEEMADAHRYVETGRKKGNVVIRVSHDE